MFLRQPYVTDFDAISDETGIFNDEPSMTQQHFHDDTKIDVILERYVQTGILPNSQVQPVFGDFIGMTDDYHEALNIVIAAEEAFYSLPAYLRERFANEPANLLRFLDDSRNRDEAIKLGLIEKADIDLVTPSPAPTPVPDDLLKVGG